MRQHAALSAYLTTPLPALALSIEDKHGDKLCLAHRQQQQYQPEDAWGE